METKRRQRKIGSRIAVCLCLLFVATLSSEATTDTLYLEVASDSVELGDVLEVRYTMENIDGEFVTPVFEGLYPMGGPSTSSSIQIINGVTQQQQSIGYLLKVTELGILTVPAGKVKLRDGGTRQTAAREVLSSSSASTEIAEHRLGSNDHVFPRPKPRKRLKTRKI